MKKFVAILVGILLTMTISGCTSEISAPEMDLSEVLVSETPVSETSVSETSVSEEESKTEITEDEPLYVEDVSANEDVHSDEELFEIYSDLIKDLYNVVFFGLNPMEDQFFGILSDVINLSSLEEKAEYGYCFYDIDHNGTKELIFGVKDTVLAVCGYDKDEKPHVTVGAGYRSYMDVYTDGIISYGGSSGAASYSLAFCSLDGEGGKDILDFYFTEEDNEEIRYYHNTTGEWDAEVSDRITEEEFGGNIERTKVDFSDDLKSLITFSNLFGGTESGVTPEDLTGTVWTLFSYTEEGENKDPAEDNLVQTITFKENGTVDYYLEKDGNVLADKKNLQYFYYDHSGSIDIYVDNAGNGNSYTITLIRIDGEGMLVAQKLSFGTDRYGVCYEYYKKNDAE